MRMCRGGGRLQNLPRPLRAEAKSWLRERGMALHQPGAPLGVCIMTADFWGLKTAGGTATAYHLLAQVSKHLHSYNCPSCVLLHLLSQAVLDGLSNRRVSGPQSIFLCAGFPVARCKTHSGRIFRDVWRGGACRHWQPGNRCRSRFWG
jgi:hypothetical protein